MSKAAEIDRGDPDILPPLSTTREPGMEDAYSYVKPKSTLVGLDMSESWVHDLVRPCDAPCQLIISDSGQVIQKKKFRVESHEAVT